MRNLKNNPWFAFSVFLLLPTLPVKAENTDAQAYVYRITLKNGMANNGLSPLVAAISKKGYSLFEVGTKASKGIAEVAENGVTEPLTAELAKNSNILAYKAASNGAGPGQTQTVELEVKASEFQNDHLLHLVSMIGKSNDTFVALNAHLLSKLSIGESYSVHASNFDSGTEENTGNLGDFGHGGHPTAQAEGRISYDRGLNFRGNAAESFAWGAKAAKVTIERLK